MQKPSREPSDIEIPQQIRQLAEETVATARHASEGFGALMGAVRDQAARTNGEVAASALEIQSAAVELAEDNIFKGFDMALRMARARDLGEVLALQAEFGEAQLKALQRQAEVIGQMVSEAADRAAKTVA